MLAEKIASLDQFFELENEIHELQKQAAAAEKEMNFIDSKISEEFAGTEKLFRSYKHSSGEKGIIDTYIKSPAQTFLTDKDMEIRGVLERIHGGMDRHSKNDRIERLLRDLELLASLREQHALAREKKGRLDEDLLRLSSRASDKRYKQEEIAGIENDIRMLLANSEGIGARIRDINAEIKADLGKLNLLVENLTGEKIAVLS
jgi:hypothetical protein